MEKRKKNSSKAGSLISGIIAIIVGIQFLYAGINMVTFIGFNPITLIPIAAGIFMLFFGFRSILGKKKKKSVKDDFEYSRPAAKASFSFKETDHEHIVSAGLTTEKRLEQLETLKGAGLLTDQEYRQRRQQILRDL